MSKANKEEWFDAKYKGEPVGYEITKTGKMRSKWYKDKHVLKQRTNSWGYWCVRMRVNNKTYNRFVHTIMAHTFLTLPEGRTYNNISVNHKDGNKLNNNVENLEYCSFTANQLHKFDTGRQFRTRGKVNCNLYKFVNDDGREFVGTPRELFYKYGEQDKLFMSGINQCTRGFAISTGWKVSHHKGWRPTLLRKRTLKEFQKEMSVDKSHIYQHFMNSDDNNYRTNTRDKGRETRRLKKLNQ
jgi:hypothetical protein